MTPEELREQIARTLYATEVDDCDWESDHPMYWVPYLELADPLVAVVSPLLATAREDGAREVLTELGTWYRGLAEKHPRFADQSFLVLAQIERFATEHYPEKEKTDG